MLSMALFLLALLSITEARINVGFVSPDVCIVAERQTSDADKINNLLDFYSFRGFTYEICQFNQDADAIDAISKCSCLYGNNTQIVAYADTVKSDLATLLGNDNDCTVFTKKTKKWIPQYDRDREYFLYAKNVRICYISESLLGMGCDSTKEWTWQNITSTDYAIADIPEMTLDGFWLFTTETAYLCVRKDSSQPKPIYFFNLIGNKPPEDQIGQTRSLATAWKAVNSILHFVYKVLDIFYRERLR
ncbi:VP7 [Rotavirus J]|uniref:VP7 n=1 Tax=Rotavirus J TaxID=1929964 RepID=A0A1L6BXL9_9REOV|nr:VP7 [Rotavirus J]APQ41759.1 VP7 [Rotavirus J]